MEKYQQYPIKQILRRIHYLRQLNDMCVYGVYACVSGIVQFGISNFRAKQPRQSHQALSLTCYLYVVVLSNQ